MTKQFIRIAVFVALLCGIANAQPIPSGGLRFVTHGTEFTGTGTMLDSLELKSCSGTGKVLAWTGSDWDCSDAASVLGAGTTNYLAKWTPDGLHVGIGNLFDDGGSVIVRGGTGTLATGVGGVHMWFLSNIGHISSTTPGTSNRELDIQGSPIVLMNGAAPLMTWNNTEAFSGTGYDFRLGRVYANTPDTSEPGFRSTRKATSPGDAASNQWGFGYSTNNTNFIWDYFNGTSWSGPWLQLTTAGDLTWTGNTTAGSSDSPTHVFQGQYIQSRTAVTDSIARIKITNDAQTWQLNTDGSNSDRFTFRNETGSQNIYAITTANNWIGQVDNSYFSWDSNLSQVGIAKKSGFQSKIAYGSGNDICIAQSSGTTISTANTFTDRFCVRSDGSVDLGNGSYDVIQGSGTLNAIAMFTPDGKTIGNSPITYNGSNEITVNTSTITHLSSYGRWNDFDTASWDGSTVGSTIISRDHALMMWEGGLSVGGYANGSTPSDCTVTGGLCVSSNARIEGNATIGIADTNVHATRGRMDFNNATQNKERIRLVGQEFYQAASTSTDGPTLLLGVNRSGNRQLWVADSAALTQNGTNKVLQIAVGTSVGVGLNALGTDGTTAQTMTLQGSAGQLDIGSNLTRFGVTAGNGYVYVNGDELDYRFGDNSAQTGYINYHGYNNGLTQYRNLSIRDGKGVELALFNATATAHGLLIVGGNTNGPSVPIAQFELSGGRQAFGGGIGVAGTGASSDMAFQWGGSGGGYRHWIATTHNSARGAGNTMDFYLNSSATAGGSSGPGTGSLQILSMSGNGVVYAPDQGFNAIGATSVDSYIKDGTSAFYTGKAGRNLLHSTDDLWNTSGSCTEGPGGWAACQFGTTLTYTRTFGASPRGVNEWFAVLQANNSSGLAWYGERIFLRETGIRDVRNKVFTFSVWAKAASGTPQLGLSITRDPTADGSGGACNLTTTWQRCSFTFTFGNTNAADSDNSQMLIYLSWSSVIALSIYGAQLEESPTPTPYVANRDTNINAVGAYGWQHYSATGFPQTQATFTPTLFAGNNIQNARSSLGAWGVYTDVDICRGNSFAPICDTEQTGTLRKNSFINSDYLYDSGSACPADTWGQCEYGSTLATASPQIISPRGVRETVLQITCTNGGTACTAGGSDYRYVATKTSTGVSDVRGQTWTYSAWFKLSSGVVPVSVTVAIARYADNDSGTGPSDCVINSTTWTRCWVTRRFNTTSYADNSEIRNYFTAFTTTPVYVYGAQLEQSPEPTGYQSNDAKLAQPVIAGSETLIGVGGYAMALIHTDIKVMALQPGSGGNNYTISFAADGTGTGTFNDGTASVFHYQTGVTTVANFCSAIASSTYIVSLIQGCSSGTISSKISAGTYKFDGAEDAKASWAQHATFGGTPQHPFVVANAGSGIGTLCYSSVLMNTLNGAALVVGQPAWGEVYLPVSSSVSCTGDFTGSFTGADNPNGSGAGLQMYGTNGVTGTLWISNVGTQQPFSVYHNPSVSSSTPGAVITGGLQTHASYTSNNMSTTTLTLLNDSAPASGQTGTKNITLDVTASGAAQNIAARFTGGLRNIMTNPGNTVLSSLTTWGDKWAAFGPSTATDTGAGVGITYNTTGDYGVIVAAAPNTAFKPLVLSGSFLQMALGSTVTLEATASGHLKIGTGGGSELMMVGNEMHFNDSSNAADAGYINYYGYNGGTTQFRTLVVADGKGSEIASFVGSSKQANFQGLVDILGSSGLRKIDNDTNTTYVELGQDWGAVNGDFYLATTGSLTDLVLDVNGAEYLRLDGDSATAKFFGGKMYVGLNGNQLNAEFDSDSDNTNATLYINARGYQNGTTRNRTLLVYDGKGNEVADFNKNQAKETIFFGKTYWSGSTPSLSSCGTSPSITGNDHNGSVTTGTSATACTLTFASAYLTNAPNCVVGVRTSSGAWAYITSVSTSALTFTLAGTSPFTFDYICAGRL